MKNNLNYYQHYSDSHNHPKFKMLRAKYGWEGEGKFWALNNMIAKSENCQLDLSKNYNKATIAIDLGFTLEEFEEFMDYLSNPKECNLLKKNRNIYTADLLQENFENVSFEREKARDRKRKRKSSGKNIESSGELSESSGEKRQSSRLKESKVKEKKESKVNTMSSTEADLDDVSAFVESQKEKQERIPYKEIITYFNTQAKTNYSSSSIATKNKIKARWNEGFRLKDFKIVIDAKVRSWLTDEKMVMYLRPDTLFSASKFEGYLQEGLKFKPKVKCKFCGLTDNYHTESCRLYVKIKEEIPF